MKFPANSERSPVKVRRVVEVDSFTALNVPEPLILPHSTLFSRHTTKSLLTEVTVIVSVAVTGNNTGVTEATETSVPAKYFSCG